MLNAIFEIIFPIVTSFITEVLFLKFNLDYN